MNNNLLAFLEQAGSGCISGQVVEWPQLVPACRMGADAVRSVEELGYELCRIKARLQVLRNSMSLHQWHEFERENPGAENWFDEDGVPL